MTRILPAYRGASSDDATSQLPPDVAQLPVVLVNVYFVGVPYGDDGSWVLVDAGLPLSAGRIRRAAEKRFGPGGRPRAIVLTHGHFDHVGALRELADEWDVPIYAHELEVPYLTGRSSYPPPDPTVGGGLMPRLSPLFPRKPIDVGDRLRVLPADGSVPPMPGWRWVHTPGHTAGHVSLFRDADRTLLAGDAFITQKQESALAVLTGWKKLHGPPKYFTSDWEAAAASVRRLAALEPAVAGTGHGYPMGGAQLRSELNELARHFEELAVPEDGRYVRAAAVTDESGVVMLPPAVPDPMPKVVAALAVAAAVAAVVMHARRSRDERD